jgi:predicted acyltransferase
MITAKHEVTAAVKAVAGNKKTRLLSLDALRGFDMFWIISGEGIFHGLAKATNAPAFNWMSNQLHHSDWNGFTFYDLIFPLFIFIAGVSMPYSYSSQLSKINDINKGLIKRTLYTALIKRTLILIVLGAVVNGLLSLKGYENTRFASVLGRIALACFFAAIIYLNCSLKKQIFCFVALLVGYWALMTLIPVPGFGAGIFTPEGNLEAYVDRLFLPGKLHRKVYDPEGLLSTIPAIGSALLGVFTGQFMLLSKQTGNKKAFLLLISGFILLFLGWCWNFWFPINKNMWTSSFVLFAGGWSVLFFTLFYSVIDIAGLKTWSAPFVWIGKNSILIYLAAHGLINFQSTAEFLFGGIIGFAPEVWKPVWLWISIAAIQFALLYFLYKKQWFLKL